MWAGFLTAFFAFALSLAATFASFFAFAVSLAAFFTAFFAFALTAAGFFAPLVAALPAVLATELYAFLVAWARILAEALWPSFYSSLLPTRVAEKCTAALPAC